MLRLLVRIAYFSVLVVEKAGHYKVCSVFYHLIDIFLIFMPNNQPIYSVSQLCRETRLILEGHFLTITVEGEISNLARPASGHIYFTLKDDKAQVQCAMFRTQLRKVGFKPNNGAQVTLKARVSLYEARGNFQLIAEQMETAGEGALRQQFEALKNKLANEGLFDGLLKKPLPSLAKKIGIITSPSGAAIHDILTVLKNRFPLIPALIYPVTVQGDTAKHEIVEAITLANKRNECDVLILARGGGSLEDLWAFNEEIVARAVHQSELPIISAVGHEVDFTIADLVADYRAPTPSAAAEAISPEQQQWIGYFEYFTQQLSQSLNANLADKRQRLETLKHRLKLSHPNTQLQRHAQRLDDYQARLVQIPQIVLQRNKLRLSVLSSQLLNNDPTRSIYSFQKRLELLYHRLPMSLQHTLRQSRIRFTECNKALETLSPIATLARGYSVSKRKSDGSIINSTKQLAVGEQISVQLTDGTLQTRLEEIIENT